ncbi:MAG: hypothetical protein Q8N63_06940 [Nanoarchaeota archaeon]|nr:hypothetical protein [Nanoarchaeota archaeon]
MEQTQPFYDLTLRFKIPSSNNNSNGIVLNEHFDSLDNFLLNTLNPDNEETEDGETRDMNRQLRRECRNHAKKYSYGIKSKNVFMLAHPFFLHLTHMNFLNEQGKREAEEYTSDLLGLLQDKDFQDRFETLLIEDPRYYAIATSLLLENGLIHDVFFTENNSGRLYSVEDFRQVEERNFFVAGEYEGRCLSTSIQELRDYARPLELGAVKDLVLKSPFDYSGSKFSDIGLVKCSEVFGVPAGKVISLQDFKKKLACETGSEETESKNSQTSNFLDKLKHFWRN